MLSSRSSICRKKGREGFASTNLCSNARALMALNGTRRLQNHSRDARPFPTSSHVEELDALEGGHRIARGWTRWLRFAAVSSCAQFTPPTRGPGTYWIFWAVAGSIQSPPTTSQHNRCNCNEKCKHRPSRCRDKTMIWRPAPQIDRCSWPLTSIDESIAVEVLESPARWALWLSKQNGARNFSDSSELWHAPG